MPGFMSLRILPKESKQYPNRTYNLCFIEFESKYQATVAMNALQVTLFYIHLSMNTPLFLTL